MAAHLWRQDLYRTTPDGPTVITRPSKTGSTTVEIQPKEGKPIKICYPEEETKKSEEIKKQE